MATIVLSAVGAAAGASIGGGVLGLSSVVIGRAVGATIGQAIDQRILGSGSQAVESGRIDRFRLTGASEGAAVGKVFGRMRVSGQVIWASRFREEVSTTTTGGKGAAPSQSVSQFSYTVSLAIAVGEGVITRIGRIWADGKEIVPSDYNLRVYPGTKDQMPDPKIETIEGAGKAPAYRGIAYIVLEDLPLAPFGNRVPQFSFEVMRGEQPGPFAQPDIAQGLYGVAMMPGTGEYALATTPVHYSDSPANAVSINVNTPSGKTDFDTSVDMLREELPNCEAVSLIVSWFGDDLRAGTCSIRPKVEQTLRDGVGMPWSVSGIGRASADAIAEQAGRPVYGGTPCDQSVREALVRLRENGRHAMFYPFILMEQLAGNGLPDPYSDSEDQPLLPWRGRITTSIAPGRAGTPDGTAQAEAEVAAFMGAALPSDFSITATGVAYSGPEEFSYRRFILHYAHLCASAGGVDSFCIGSEMRGLTQIRGRQNSFPAVAALRLLAQEVRAILGPETKVGYAADWSEYFGYHPQGSGDVFFHLDPLWASPDIDFIGIDNYMPLSDWRDGFEHADADWGSIYNLDYLKANVAGGEGYDWFYHAPEAAEIQLRRPIEDGAFGEPWVFRYKDIRNWWSNRHHDRIDGVRQSEPTAWEPRSKPIWFTEFGCPAVDKGTNQPNKFVDPKSSESSLPVYSNGRRDDYIQMQYYNAVIEYWSDAANNPVSNLYEGPMVDISRAYAWAWDARPFPHFPSNAALWSDGENYAKGHWLNGRVTSRSLASIVAEICVQSGITEFDVREVYGVVKGYVLSETDTGRAALQPLMVAYGFDAIEAGGKLVFKSRSGRSQGGVGEDDFALAADLAATVEKTRAPQAEVAGRLRLGFVESDGDYETRSAEAVFPDAATQGVAQSNMALVLTQAEARAITERWLAEARVARDGLRFALPPSRLAVKAGDVLRLEVEPGVQLYRVDRVEQAEHQVIEAVRIEPELYQPSDWVEEIVVPKAFLAPVPVFSVFLDLPLITGSEVPHAPYIAASAMPWPGGVSVFKAGTSGGFEANATVSRPATIGRTLGPLFSARPARWDRAGALRVELYTGALASADPSDVLNGANAIAIGDGASDVWEVFQFARADLVAPNTYELSQRLRGQLGTDAVMPAEWPPGSTVVLLDRALVQLDLPSSARGLARRYRVGPSTRPYTDLAYTETTRAFDGTGLRPYAPTHLRMRRGPLGDLRFSWIRRTRIDGDSWEGAEVPLGEGSEAYLFRVVQNGQIRREEVLGQPEFLYSNAMIGADGVLGSFSVQVAQLSDRYGAGSFSGITIND